jgi:hypothetical protein
MSEVIFNTSGDGYWSRTINAQVRITDMTLGYISDELDFGELRVYFDTDTWDVNALGLIYTDKLFMRQLQKFLAEHGLVGQDVSYSEQGMQGDDYVSCDVGKKFLDSWAAKFGTDLAQLLAEQTAAFEARNAFWKEKFFG